jgi:pimeloyl-ACP methyl ester carboxylesterase
MRPSLSLLTALLQLLALAALNGWQRADSADHAAAVAPTAAVTPFDRPKQRVTLSTGITMTYVEAGNRLGPAVILLHGFTDTSRSFFPMLDALERANTNLHVFALDACGHGGSSMPQEPGCAAAPEQCFEPDDFAADVLAFMYRKGIAKAHIVAHSMGTMAAQHLALTHPERVESLMLIGTFVQARENAMVQELLVPRIEQEWKRAVAGRPGFSWPRDAYLLTPRDVDPTVDAWMLQNLVVDPAASPELIAGVLPETSTTRLGTWIGGVRSIARFDYRERLRQLTVPTLVIWATQDNAFPAAEQVRVRAALDGAVAACRTRYFFKTYGKQPLPASGTQETDLGHNTQWGAPQAIAADVEAWIATGRPTPDLPYADGSDLRKLAIARGAAALVERAPAGNCMPAASDTPAQRPAQPDAA